MDDYDEFDDDWDDFTPSLQDTLYETLQMIESNAAAKLESEKDIDDKDGDFDVFLDELFEIPFRGKEKKRKETPLGEICVNQQHRNLNTQHKESKVDECSIVYDSQDERIWSNVDIDLLANIEMYPTNVQKEIEPTKASMRPSTPPPAVKLENSPYIMKGFTTASGKALKPVSENAKNMALALFKDEECKEEKPAMTGFATASGKSLGPVSKKAQREAFLLFEKLDDGINVDSSVANLKKTTFGEAFEKPSRDNIDSKSQSFANDSEMNALRSNHAKHGLKRPLDTESKYEKELARYGGFQMGNSKKAISVSSKAKREAITMFERDSTVPDSPKSASTVPDVLLKQVMNDTPTKLPSKNDTQQSIPIQSKSNKRFKTPQKYNKPFKSPIIRSNIELTKAAISNKSYSKPKGLPVFNLTPIENRYKLSSLGKPLSYSKQQLICKEIPYEIINMTLYKAESYMFQGIWGWKDAQKSMIQSNCVSTRLTSAWVQNHYALIVWKIACQIRSYPDQLKDQWRTETVLSQLLYRYEREVNMGQSPALKKVLEQDDNSVKHMILVIVDIIETKSSSSYYNTSNKYQLLLSDGWYKVLSLVDLRMEHAIARKKLKIGYKLSICGAQIVGDKTAQSPLSIRDSETMLSISSNGCLPARWDEKLGYHRRKLVIRSIPTIFDDGGTVTAIDIVVCRKFPILYRESLPNGMTITRTAKEEEDTRRKIEPYDGFNGFRRQHSYGFPNFRANSKVSNAPHQDRTASEPKTLQERRVDGYFRVRVCDALHGSQQPWATLLLSNANELNHMDVVEGNRFKVFFVQPYHPKSKKYPGLDLKTTLMTRWEPVASVATKNAYIPRFLTLCANIRHQDKLSDFDLAVYILRSPTMENLNGRKLWHQTLLVTDKSRGVCQIEFRLPLNYFHDMKGHIIGLANVRFDVYDTKYDITCLKATDETEITTKLSSSIEYLQKGMNELRGWVEQHHDYIKAIEDRVQEAFH
ncbi:hypothetical protein [Parasitella parasitica]|uniref:BRCA2 OB1 domain-containing protein n=1 Tax=Parasitella parasitica TaxID=35722 RepID=A0A0B7N5X0_9FUNG|nr:hypothetical protein [Parasitella parasitica]